MAVRLLMVVVCLCAPLAAQRPVDGTSFDGVNFNSYSRNKITVNGVGTTATCP